MIDNKGTVKTAINNRVTYGAPPATPLEGDVWFDTAATPIEIKIWDDNVWRPINDADYDPENETNTAFSVVTVSGIDYLRITDAKGSLDVPLSSISQPHTGTPGSVFFAGTDGKPTENNSQLFWDATNTRLFIGPRATNDINNELNVGGSTRTSGLNNSDGTEGLPSYRFTNDKNTGMYTPDSDILAFTTAGIEALRIDDDQQVNANYNLSVVGAYKDSSGDSGTNGQILSSTATGTNWVNASINTDDQKIDVYALNADGKNLDLSLESDAETTKQTDLSALNIAGDVTGTLAASKVEKIQNIAVSNTVPTNGQILTYDTTASEWQPKVATNWNITGNIGTTASQFLGTIDDVRMQIRSNNLPMLEFGRRATLGLVTGNADYTNANQPLVHLNGDGNISALQFAASGAGYYKPMFFTTTNGSFRLKGSSGNTDLFEIGSAGPTNDGRLELIIGDDGSEPIIFKSYNYRNSGFHKELFRVQGNEDSEFAKTRFGININPAPVAVDDTYNTTAYGNTANSTFQVNGSVSKSIVTTSAALTLDEDHHTIVLGGNHTITLPTANTCEGRIYVIKNPNTYATSISGYVNEQGVTGIATVNSTSTLWLQSDGTNWQQISNKSSASTGKSLFSVTTTAAIPINGVSIPSAGVWYNLDFALPSTTINVQAGDIIDVRVSISEELSFYNQMGDLLRLYVNTPSLVGSPTMIETLFAGGLNNNYVAAATLSQMFTVTGNGTLTMGIQVKFVNTSSRLISSSDSGIGALQVIIYR
ncbi:hypothetical protein [Polaribacter butkevichii]|uniref:Tail fiber protein n=1 Tax=Polaribacter butkevichii TaxID=218490 RepID=A0A2P6CEH9_9FLAO|nr:hypothetical protein [Polaribacter butkevichii]PQJ73286.1 hypothetical protein BTO14_08435 [Polaribacter butkevichii]